MSLTFLAGNPVVKVKVYFLYLMTIITSTGICNIKEIDEIFSE